MNRLLVVLAVLTMAAPLLSFLLAEHGGPNAAMVQPSTRREPLPALDTVEPAESSFSHPAEDDLYRDASRVAWTYIEGQYQAETGLVNSVIGYPYATVWDIASTLAAYYSAVELGLIDRSDYDRRMGRALRTLGSLRLFEDAALGKNYHIERGVPAGRNDRDQSPAAEGRGWSATDLGRLLIWLRIVASSHPQHAEAAEAVVRRLNFDRIVKDDYLWGALIGRRGKTFSFQEGRIGYEQYAAAGFALWGHAPERALQLELNADPIEVLGIQLYDDRRGQSFLTSEPFVLLGLELGWWHPSWKDLARQVLAAQERRFDRTGQLTVVSEDALPVGPEYFYYYTVQFGGQDFAVATLTSPTPRTGPRWLSAKAAFAWHALFPNPYTWKLLEAVAPAADAELGWSSGIFESTAKATGAQNVNTAAVILESALYRVRGTPLIASAGIDPQIKSDSGARQPAP